MLPLPASSTPTNSDIDVDFCNSYKQEGKASARARRIPPPQSGYLPRARPGHQGDNVRCHDEVASCAAPDTGTPGGSAVGCPHLQREAPASLLPHPRPPMASWAPCCVSATQTGLGSWLPLRVPSGPGTLGQGISHRCVLSLGLDDRQASEPQPCPHTVTRPEAGLGHPATAPRSRRLLCGAFSPLPLDATGRQPCGLPAHRTLR